MGSPFLGVSSELVFTLVVAPCALNLAKLITSLTGTKTVRIQLNPSSLALEDLGSDDDDGR